MSPRVRPLACLLLLASTGAESWKSWLARGAAGGFQNFVHATAEIDDARTSAHSLRIDGKVLSVKELEFALLGARLAFLAYARSRWEVEAGLKDARMELVCFAPQRAQARVGVPQWYLARSGEALYLVFRGTSSVFDVLHDLMAMPEDGTEDDRFHAGFLHAVHDVAAPVCDALAAELRRGRGGGGGGEGRGGGGGGEGEGGEGGGGGGEGGEDGGGGAYERLYLVGHSLGGALALTLLGADLLPGAEELEGRALPPVSVLTYGSPAAFHRRCVSRAVRSADVQAFVYGSDLVPRLLGSPLPLLHQAVGFALGSRAARRWSQEAFDTLTEYVHPPRQALVYVEPLGAARHVPSSQHEQLLHLHQALVPEMVQHHLEYVSGLEAAWHRAVVEAGAARAAGTAAFDAAATGRAVVGLVQRIAGRGRSSKAEQGKDGV